MQVHRFHDYTAVHLPGMEETCYLSAKEARALARALNACARSIKNEGFIESTFPTTEIPLENGGRRHATNR